MNCKVHPTAEAVTTCAACDAGMCSQCSGIFYTENDKPLCLECSLKEAEENLEDCKYYQKDTLIRGIIGSVIWIVGICLASFNFESSVVALVVVGLLIMLGAAVFFYRKTLFMSEEEGFFKKLKDIFFAIIFGTLLLPFMVISCLIEGKWKIIKSKSKVKKIKAALGKAD